MLPAQNSEEPGAAPAEGVKEHDEQTHVHDDDGRCGATADKSEHIA